VGTYRVTVIKLHPVEKWVWPLARGAPKILGFPYNISATADSSSLEFVRYINSVIIIIIIS